MIILWDTAWLQFFASHSLYWLSGIALDGAPIGLNCLKSPVRDFCWITRLPNITVRQRLQRTTNQNVVNFPPSFERFRVCGMIECHGGDHFVADLCAKTKWATMGMRSGCSSSS
ncbi:hypothetical protein NPIL_339971 [Nephila pilipes]|uniref:Secreted protein n=1 Tax=Nephila pilipes TaxID=299642 RepID=A0A8X6NX92_NEPPI|nr:hypothetical protein NPIL_339971 [Nephila pilipes]